MTQIINPKKPQLQVADILRNHIADYQKAYPLWSEHRKIVSDLLNCRTPHLGGQSGLVRRDLPVDAALGTFHHQMHHRYFECNYGSLEMPWDKWFGSFHDGTVEANERMQERRKRLMGQ